VALLIACAVFAVLGLVVLFDVGGTAGRLAGLGRRLKERHADWWSVGTPTSTNGARALGAVILLVALALTAFPPQ
jgi:hypothetical protein